MALGGRDVLKLVVDADSAGAVKEFDKLGREIKKTVGDADKGASGFKQKFGTAFAGLAERSTVATNALAKLGVSGEQAGMAIASAIPAAAIAAGAGLALFAAKGVQAFQSTALAADKFSDSTGMGVEEASKWIAVADDVGVSAGTFQSAFVKMEKAIETNRSAFGDLVATTASGATDLSATFLNVITHLQGIEDPILRANEASKFFGRGFAEVSEIITTDAGELRTALEGVSDVQIIDEAEVEKARAFQLAMDNLGEVVRDLSIQVGEQLVPALTDMANMVSSIKGWSDAGGGALGFLAGQVENVINPLEGLRESWHNIFGGSAEAEASVGRLGIALSQTRDRTNQLAAANTAAAGTVTTVSTSFGNFEARAAAAGNAMQRQADATNAANTALQGLLNTQLAEIDAAFAVTNATNNFVTANENAGRATDDTSTAVNEQQVAYDGATQAAISTASATVRLAQEQASLEGKTLSAKQSQDVLIGTLQRLAGQASGPTAAAIGAVITKLQAVGAQRPRPTITVNDQTPGPMRAVSDRIHALDGMSATVRVNAETGGALANVRNLLNAMSRLSVPVRAAVRQEGGPIPGSRNTPVPVIAHGGEYVLSADVVDRIKRGDTSRGASASLSLPGGGGGGGGTVVNFNGTFLASKAELGRMVDEAVAESRRRGNRAA